MSIKPLLPFPGKVAVSIAHGVKTMRLARASEVRLGHRPQRVKGLLTALTPPGDHLEGRPRQLHVAQTYIAVPTGCKGQPSGPARSVIQAEWHANRPPEPNEGLQAPAAQRHSIAADAAQRQRFRSIAWLVMLRAQLGRMVGGNGTRTCVAPATCLAERPAQPDRCRPLDP